MKKAFSMFLLVSVVTFVSAQNLNSIIYQGREYEIDNDSLFKPPFLKYISKNSDDDRSINGLKFKKSFWYYQTYQIANKRLLLKGFYARKRTGDSVLGWVSSWSEIYPDSSSVSANWFSGILVLKYGRVPRFIILEISDGNLLGERRMNQTQFATFKNSQFELFRKTEEYEEVVNRLQSRGYTASDLVDKAIERNIFNYLSAVLKED